MTRDERIYTDAWNEAIETALHQARHICPDAKELHDALEACLLKEGEDDT